MLFEPRNSIGRSVGGYQSRTLDSCSFDMAFSMAYVCALLFCLYAPRNTRHAMFTRQASERALRTMAFELIWLLLLVLLSTGKTLSCQNCVLHLCHYLSIDSESLTDCNVRFECKNRLCTMVLNEWTTFRWSICENGTRSIRDSDAEFLTMCNSTVT